MEAEPSPLRCCSEPKAPLELEPELEPATALERWAGGGLRWVANRSASFPAQHWSHWSPSPLPPPSSPASPVRAPAESHPVPPARKPAMFALSMLSSSALLFRFLLCEWNAQLTAPHAPRRIAETEAWPPLRPLNPIEHEQAGELELEKKKKDDRHRTVSFSSFSNTTLSMDPADHAQHMHHLLCSHRFSCVSGSTTQKLTGDTGWTLAQYKYQA